MLKKSKRILSVVLALIMICSAMSIMSFAAESEEEFTRTVSFRAPTYNANGYASYTDVSVRLSGGYSVTPDYYGWFNAPYVAFNPDDGVFEYSYSRSNNSATIDIYIYYWHEDTITGALGLRESYHLRASLVLDGTGRITMQNQVGLPGGGWGVYQAF